jgi:hypothetical protein
MYTVRAEAMPILLIHMVKVIPARDNWNKPQLVSKAAIIYCLLI